jgi:mono/diheme cytochrome c family protein
MPSMGPRSQASGSGVDISFTLLRVPVIAKINRMSHRLVAAACAVFTVVFLMVSSTETASLQGWKIPAAAKEEKNPLPVDDALLAAGKKLFLQKCQRCHGPEGKGDGPDSDTDHVDHMDLTNPKHAEANPDGVVFYKVWHGRQEPRMPAFEDQLTKEQAWTVVAYAQSLRKR